MCSGTSCETTGSGSYCYISVESGFGKSDLSRSGYKMEGKEQGAVLGA